MTDIIDIKSYKHPDSNLTTIMGSFMTDTGTSNEKIMEIFQEYLEKKGVKNVDVRVWSDGDLYTE